MFQSYRARIDAAGVLRSFKLEDGLVQPEPQRTGEIWVVLSRRDSFQVCRALALGQNLEAERLICASAIAMGSVVPS